MSISTKTGFNPQCSIALIGATKVKSGTIISSPFFNLRIEIANCNAVVPLLVDKAYFDFVNFENFFSNKSTYFPIDEIHPD